MSDVLVAVITGGATLVGVAIPIITSAIETNAKDKSARQERVELEKQRLQQENQLVLQERRKECAALVRLARDFRVAVQNNYEYHGPDKAERAWDIRQRAADITSLADEIGLMVPALVTAADSVADEANRLVGIAADPQSLALRSSTQPTPPDTAVLDRRIKEFKAAAQSALYGAPSPRETSLMQGEFLGELAV